MPMRSQSREIIMVDGASFARSWQRRKILLAEWGSAQTVPKKLEQRKWTRRNFYLYVAVCTSSSLSLHATKHSREERKKQHQATGAQHLLLKVCSCFTKSCCWFRCWQWITLHHATSKETTVWWYGKKSQNRIRFEQSSTSCSITRGRSSFIMWTCFISDNISRIPHRRATRSRRFMLCPTTYG